MSSRKLFSWWLLLALLTSVAKAQSTAFTQQGRLTDNNVAANGAYDLQFALFDALNGGAQQGATITRDDVPVTNGVFSVQLDFGATPFNGAARWLQISVRAGTSTGAFTPLTPRQPLSATPYAIRSQAAATADALSANCVGCITATQLQNGGSFIQNATTPQANANFNISGDGTAGGTLSGNAVNAATQYNLGGNRVLAVSGAGQRLTSNTFAGVGAGANSTPDAGGFGGLNSFFGNQAGATNATGFHNAFVGYRAGLVNTTGAFNTFVGSEAGLGNTTGGNNAFVGFQAGAANTTGSNNTMLGSNANVGAAGLSYATALGAGAVVASSNTLVLGRSADTVQIPGAFSSSILSNPGTTNTLLGSGATVSPGVSYATAIGAGAVVAFSNGIVLGRPDGSDRVRMPGGILAGLALNDSLLFLRGGADTSQRINYDVAVNGTAFGAPGGFRWLNTAGAVAQERMRLDGNGLSVSGELTLNNHSLRLRGVGDSNHEIRYDAGLDGLQFRAWDQFQWVRASDNFQQMKLHGNGNLELRGVVLVGSDGRYKTDVQSLPQALAQVLRLRGVSYHWQPELKRDPRLQIGFIAQEVEAVLPELVSTDEQGFKSVAYANAVPVLVEAIKEQQQQLAAQQRQIAELQAQLAALAARLPQPKADGQR